MTATIRHSPLTARLLRAIGDWIATNEKDSGRLCIVNYHRILPAPDPLLDSEPDIETFRWQMELLAKCFNVLPLYDAVQMLGVEPMPPRAVCITFDDGYRSTYELALPVLKELNLPATVFVTAGCLDKSSMWNDKIIEAIRRLPVGELDLSSFGLKVYSLRTIEDRRYLAQKLTDDSKYLSPGVRIQVAERLEMLAGGTSSDKLMLTTEMVAALAHNGIEIGGHTVTHPILTRLNDDEARQEITEGKLRLEQITGYPVRLFAYPNGKVGVDFDHRHARMAKEAGFVAGFTTAMGAATPEHERYQIPRNRPWDKSPLFFGLRLLGWLARKSA